MEDLKLCDIEAPQLLTAAHDCCEFRCGQVVLDRWFQERAVSNQASGASRTYVVATTKGVVIGYYALAPTAIDPSLATGAVRRNSPSPVPMYLLGQLAVDSSWNGKGLGSALLQDAFSRVKQAAQIAGGKALICQAIDDRAKSFYLHQGWRLSPIDPMLVMVPL